MQIRAVIFDLDGLIIDSEPLHQRAFNTYLQRHNVGYQFGQDEYARFFVGIPVRHNAEYLITRFGLACTPEELLAEREAEFEALIRDGSNLEAMPGLLSLLDELNRQKVELGVASASPRAQVEVMLDGLGLRSRFQVVVAGTDVPRTKPAPDVYLRAVEDLKLPKEKCIAVEDSATGIKAAKAAGLVVVAIPNQYTRRQDLSEADVHLKRLDELGALIKRRE
jgi:HAD superfamily hydrolase (TIGR01509 family)